MNTIRITLLQILKLVIISLLVGCQKQPASSTRTSIPTSTTTIKITSIISPTPTLIESPSSEIPLKKIIAVVKADGQINLVGEDLKTIKSYPNRYNGNYYDLENCSITGYRVLLDGLVEKMEISTIYFNKEKIQSEIALVLGDDHHFDAYNFTISPDRHWIAYKKIAGDYGMWYAYAKIQNVMLLQVDSFTPRRPIQLTSNGGAWPSEVSWSPDGRYLAFTDSDQNSISQIYIYNLETQETKQLTNFGVGSSGILIDDLKWSYSSTKLVFSSKMDTSDLSEIQIRIINVFDPNSDWIEIPLQTGEVHQIWWSKDENRLLVFLFTPETDFKVLWYDLMENTIIHTRFFNQNNIQTSQTFPITDDLDTIVLFSYPVQIYTLSHDSSIAVNRPETAFTEDFELISSASGFLWESYCHVNP